MTAPNLLVIGDVFSPEMRPALSSIEALVERGAVARFSDVGWVESSRPTEQTAIVAGSRRASTHPTIKQTHRDSGNDWFPDLVLVCQHWPDEFTDDDVRQLLAQHPLARMICCYGPWCASDGRRRDIWPLSVRVPARTVADRIGRELEVIAGSRAPLPLTASRDEIFLFECDGPIVLEV